MGQIWLWMVISISLGDEQPSTAQDGFDIPLTLEYAANTSSNITTATGGDATATPILTNTPTSTLIPTSISTNTPTSTPKPVTATMTATNSPTSTVSKATATTTATVSKERTLYLPLIVR